MASSSTSSSNKSFKYDVFLSFRGEDTRKNFVDHLYVALHQKNIRAYKDDERIKKGKRITDELIKSIEDSQFYIIVFSKNYASSSWCLDELVKIIECQRVTARTAYPVFYDVEPFEVRKQCGLVGKAFAKHTKKEFIVKWKEALREAADLAGWALKNTFDGHEAKFIQNIVEEISLDLHNINSISDGKRIGMETHAKDVVDDTRIEGIGCSLKTTIGKVVFDQISPENNVHDVIKDIWNHGVVVGLKTTIGKVVYNQITSKNFVDNVVKGASKASLSGLKLFQNQVPPNALNRMKVENRMKNIFGRKLHYNKNVENA